MKRNIFLIPCLLCSMMLLNAQDYPAAPEIISASVETSGNKIKLSWQKSTTPDITGYVIMRSYEHHGITDYLPVDTVYYNTSNTFSWMDNEADPSLKTYSYRVYAYKVNGSGKFDGIISTTHTTMLLTYDFDSCRNRVDLKWTAYEGAEISKYFILYEVGVGRYDILNTIPITSTNRDNKTFNYVYPNYKDNQTVNFKIGAAKKSETAPSIFSNFETVIVHYVRSPRFIRNIDISSAGSGVDLEYFIDKESEVKQFQLYRYSSNTYKDSVMVKDTTTDDIVYYIKVSDNSSNIFTHKEIYYYRLYALNDCGLYSKNSKGTSTIVLTAGNQGMVNKLEWKTDDPTYEGAEFEIYRSDRGTNPQLLTKTTAKSFEENISDAYDKVFQLPAGEGVKGDFCYMVKTEVPLDTLRRKVTSNISCISIKPQIYCPTAFCPNSNNEINKVFKPAIAGILGSYTLIIFNRWGEKVFETNQYDTPWDGKLPNGNFAPAGTYFYHVDAEMISGQKMDKKQGIVTLFYR